jgi:hypothetical protein
VINEPVDDATARNAHAHLEEYILEARLTKSHLVETCAQASTAQVGVVECEQILQRLPQTIRARRSSLQITERATRATELAGSRVMQARLSAMMKEVTDLEAKHAEARVALEMWRKRRAEAQGRAVALRTKLRTLSFKADARLGLLGEYWAQHRARNHAIGNVATLPKARGAPVGSPL